MKLEEEFWKGFDDELRKEAAIPAIVAGIGVAAARALPFLARAGTALRGLFGGARAAAAASKPVQAAGQFLAAHPKIQGVAKFTGNTMLQGAAYDAGMAPFEQRKKIIEVGSEPVQDRMMLRQFRGDM